MSRIGRSPITVPAGVEVKIEESNHVVVKGPKGSIEKSFVPQLIIDQKDGVVTVSRPNDEKENRSLHGLTRSLISGMIIGVSEGYKKDLQIHGVGYKAAKDGKKLVLNIGFSHQIIIEDTDDVTTESPNATSIIVSGIDKQKVGQFAADIRKKRPPEPYKGKGIRYANEVVRHKEGKTGAK